MASTADIIKKNRLVFVDGLITTKMPVHLYDPSSKFGKGKAARHSRKIVPHVQDNGRHAAACIDERVYDAPFFGTATAYNGTDDGQAIPSKGTAPYLNSFAVME